MAFSCSKLDIEKICKELQFLYLRFMLNGLIRIMNFTTASACGKSLNEFQIKISHAYSRISKWIDANKLVLNKKKLNLLFFVELGAGFHN